MTHPTERAPTLEQVQRDRELIARTIADYCGHAHVDWIEQQIAIIQDKLAPLPEPEPKTVPTTNGDGEHIEYRRFADGRYEIRGAEAFNGNKWGATAYTDEQVRALASLLPENATPAAQPAPTPRRFTLEQILEKAPRILGELNGDAWYLRRECGSGGGATDAIRHAITLALTAEQEPRAESLCGCGHTRIGHLSALPHECMSCACRAFSGGGET